MGQLILMKNWKKCPVTLNQKTETETETERCPSLTSHSLDDLVRHVPDLFDWKWLKVILLQEIVGAEAEQLKGDTDVAVVVKPVQDLHTRP